MSDGAIAIKPLQALQTSEAQWKTAIAQAEMLIASGMLPKTIDKPAKAIVVMMTGKELGFETMQSFSLIDVIEGRPKISARGKLHLVFKRYPNAIFDIVESTEQICRVMAARPNGKPREFTFSIEEAQRAGLTRKDNWQRYPKAMLRNRVTSQVCDALFPECVSGAVTPDEADEIAIERDATPEHRAQSADLAKSLTERLKARAEAVPVEFDPLAEETEHEGPF